jgi:hypothetical protein
MRRLRCWIAGVVLLVSSAAGASFVIAPPASGHMPLHIGCSNHNHGPKRTAGEGRRLLDARALNRLAREQQQ